MYDTPFVLSLPSIVNFLVITAFRLALPLINSLQFTPLHSTPRCVVELYGMEVGSAYQNAFLYIRQLSLLLRRAMQHKTRDAVQSVRRWQVMVPVVPTHGARFMPFPGVFPPCSLGGHNGSSPVEWIFCVIWFGLRNSPVPNLTYRPFSSFSLCMRRVVCVSRLLGGNMSAPVDRSTGRSPRRGRAPDTHFSAGTGKGW